MQICVVMNLLVSWFVLISALLLSFLASNALFNELITAVAIIACLIYFKKSKKITTHVDEKSF